MKPLPCKDCGRNISRYAKWCVYCGRPLPTSGYAHVVANQVAWVVVVVIAYVLLLAACAVG